MPGNRQYMNEPVFFFVKFSFPMASCFVIEQVADPAKSPEPAALQKIQPPCPTFPSLFGQVIPPLSVILYTFSP